MSAAPVGRRGNYLWLDVALPDDERVAFVANRAAPGVPVLDRVQVEISARRTDALVRVGCVHTVAATDRAVAEFVYGAVHDRVLQLARTTGWIRLHMAMVEMAGKRIGIAGGSGAGKTTTVVSAARAGATVHGDEVVFVRDGESVALPRPLHIKSDTWPMFPETGGPMIRLDYTPPIGVLDPAVMGWGAPCNTVAPLDMLVMLDHGSSHPQSRPGSVAHALEVLLPDAAAFDGRHSQVVREIAALVTSVPLITVGRGTPAAMAATILDAAAGCP